MKMKLLGFLAAMTLGIAATASAATVERKYDIALTQTDLGDAGPDWFGRLTILCDGSVRTCDGSVRTFSLMLDGVRYQTLVAPFPGAPTLVDNPAFWPSPALMGIVLPAVPVPGVVGPVLQFGNTASVTGGVTTYFNNWGISDCDIQRFCGGGQVLGTYSVTLAPVPLPAALPLAAGGLAALALLRRRRRAA
jgi:hypothetical protein